MVGCDERVETGCISNERFAVIGLGSIMSGRSDDLVSSSVLGNDIHWFFKKGVQCILLD